MPLRYALDTNVLLRLSHRSHPEHDVILNALRRLALRRVELCFTPQNLGEFWNASTRPLERNGFGLSPQEASEQVRSMEQRLTLLPENQHVYQVWKRLLLLHNVRGVQVHDAHLAAMLAVHDVAYLLTLNSKDFKRFPFLISLHPSEVEL